MARPLLTLGLRLRPLAAPDREFYGRLYADPKLMAQVGPPLSHEAAEAAFGRVLRQISAQPPRACYWILHARINEDPLGLMALVFDRDDHASAEVGVLLLPAAQRRGHATEAIAALVDSVFSEPGIGRIWTRHAPGHVAMIRLMRSLGFTQQIGLAADAAAGTQRMVRWQLLRADWRPGR